MDAPARYELLLTELEGFVGEEIFAIQGDDWAYLAEILRKKQGHLRGLVQMKSQVDLNNLTLRALLHRVEGKEAVACAALEKKLEEAHRAQDALDVAKMRLNKIKEMTGLRHAASSKLLSASA
jgi:hypothetical protein